MTYKEYKDTNKIKQAKKILNKVQNKLRTYTRSKKIRFGLELMGSGKNGVVLTPKNSENQGDILFDLDFQIMITRWATEEQWKEKFKIVKNKLIKLFEEEEFTLSNSHERCYKFYPKNSNESNFCFRFEMIFTVYDKKTGKKYEIITKSDGSLIREEEKQTVKPITYQKLKIINRNNLRPDLVENYIKKRENNEIRPHYQSFVMAVNEVCPD